MTVCTPKNAIDKIKQALNSNGRVSFVTAFIMGIITHMAILTSDVPNHDGLGSMYFDQNMITSGRWFLCAAASISSFFSVPWLSGILSIFFLSITAVLIVHIFDIKEPLYAALTATVLVAFPTLTSNFAYVFTMDGYMLGLLLSVGATYLVKPTEGKIKPARTVIAALMLGFGMGVYQSYLAVTMLIALFMVAGILLDDSGRRRKLSQILNIALFGMGGVVFYYAALKVLLFIQHKSLADYQGIGGMTSGNGVGLINTVKFMYKDFVSFSFGGHVFSPNVITWAALTVLLLITFVSLIILGRRHGKLTKPLTYIVVLAFLLIIPCVTNAILLISTEVTYHALMRYQWVILIVYMISIVSRFVSEKPEDEGNSFVNCISWILLISLTILGVSYITTDNVAYSNLTKRYEKTYAYCVRLADRIETTPGYEDGMPIAMVGVVGDVNFPKTDITGDVTGNLIGINGDFLLWKGEHYRDFMKYYLGVTINVLPEDNVIDFYNEDFYAKMPSFPDEGSIKIVDGVMYIKTENVR